MATFVRGGPLKWSGRVEADGHRAYTVAFRVNSTTGLDGPANVLACPQLPRVGDVWLFLGDADLWAWCRPERSAAPKVDAERNRYWEVELAFSTRPIDRCHDNPVEDPLLIPHRVSGNSVKYTEEATEDRFGTAITNSAHEQVRGQQVEFDKNNGQIKVEQNVPLLEADLVESMMNTVNASLLWGFSPRCVKLSDWSWTKAYFGACETYYTRSLVFDTNTRTFDRNLLDEGTKALSGHWDATTGEWTLDDIGGSAPDPDNPAHFVRVQDRNGNPMRVVLNGAGVPISINPGTGTGDEPGTIRVERYTESDFLLLGVPAEL